MSKTTNKLQYEKLFQLLSERPDLAQGYTKLSKEEVLLFWEQVKCELNALGPPSKEASVWRKVWLDWKSYIKRKLVENKNEGKATGGGECRKHSFSNLEEGVIKLAGLHTSTSGITNTSSFGCGTSAGNQRIEAAKQPENNVGPELDEPADVSMSSDHGMQRKNLSSTVRKEDDTANLLKKQIELQQTFYSKTEKYYEEQIKLTEDIAVSTKRIYRGIDKLCDMKKIQTEEIRRHNKIQEELLEKKIEIKLKMLHMEEEKLDCHYIPS